MPLVLEIKNSFNNYLKVLFLKSIAFQSKTIYNMLKNFSDSKILKLLFISQWIDWNIEQCLNLNYRSQCILKLFSIKLFALL
jgi:hypothetical protein